MRKADWIGVCTLLLIVLLIFYPLFYATYVYTDEVVQLWMYRKGSDFSMFTSQGRYITEKLFQWLFSSIDTITQITYIRLFSLFGWMLCIPVWYYIIKKVVTKEGLPQLLTFFSVLYLICTPPFAIYVQWASCLELFLANTSGLISGYILYAGISSSNGIVQVPTRYILFSVLFGIVALFTYQTGFGCFLLPFLLHLIAKPKSTRIVFIGIGIFIATYLLYYLLFKYNLKAHGIAASERTSLFIAPGGKLKFLFTKPLAGSFHFTYIFNEKNIYGYIVYALLFIGWIVLSFLRRKSEPLLRQVPFFLIVFLIFALAYIPGLVVRENYASNRTLLALNMAVFFLVAETLFHYVQRQKVRKWIVAILAVLFMFNAWYNFNKLFLEPVSFEYAQLRKFIDKNHNDKIKTYHFIRPEEDFFVRQYGLTRSWDEFGVPSSFFSWVPEFLVKQLVYEKTGNRSGAASLTIEHWLGKAEYQKAGKIASDSILLIDAEAILAAAR